MNYHPTASEVQENIKIKLARQFGCTPQEASTEQLYKAVALTIKDILTEKRGSFKKKVNEHCEKRVYYMCTR